VKEMIKITVKNHYLLDDVTTLCKTKSWKLASNYKQNTSCKACLKLLYNNLIKNIENRITSEQKKHQTLNWTKLAAIKIATTFEEDIKREVLYAKRVIDNTNYTIKLDKTEFNFINLLLNEVQSSPLIREGKGYKIFAFLLQRKINGKYIGKNIKKLYEKDIEKRIKQKLKGM
jgi:hypothetical protein